MTRDEKVIKKLSKYFAPYELVGREAWNRHGSGVWKFFDIRILECILIIRENLGKPITANTWMNGGDLDERGLRTNVQEIFKGHFQRGHLYLSGHVLGKALDFDVKGMAAEQVRNWIVNNADLFPCKIRLESGVSWVHLDVIQDPTKPKIYMFNA